MAGKDTLLDDLLFTGHSDVELLDLDDKPLELNMGNLIMGGAQSRAGNAVVDSYLLMDEVDNVDELESLEVRETGRAVSSPSCSSSSANAACLQFARDDHCHGPLPVEDVKSRNQLVAVSCCCFFFMVAEIVGGLIANSLAIATDATHLACDLAGFLVSLFAIWISKKPPTRRMSFGYYRAEVVGALVSVLLIWALTAALVVMAVHRVRQDDYEIEGVPMIVTASLGVFFNIVMGVVLHSGFAACNIRSSFGHGHSHAGGGGHGHSHAGGGGHGHSHNHHEGSYHHHPQQQQQRNNYVVVAADDDDFGDHTFSSSSLAPLSLPPLRGGGDGVNGSLPADRRSRSRSSSSVWSRCFDVSDNLNVRAAFVHVVGDFLQSIGVFIAALIIIVKPEYKIADPICTFVFSALVLCTTLSVIKDVLLIILEGVPASVDYQEVKDTLMSIPGVRSVHALNIWSITVDKTALNVHLAVCNPREDWDGVLRSAQAMVRSRHNIFLSTIQVEPYDDDAMRNCSRCIHP